MKNTKSSAAVLLYFLPMAILFSFRILAVQLPRVISSEKRFRAFVYSPNEVYRYIGHYLSQSYIEFEEGEKVQTISMGDTSSWQTVVMDNKLFLKPVLSFANTNMTVMTSKRTYHFELDAVEAASVMEDDVLFYVKFMYPETVDKNIVILNTNKKRSDLPDLRNLDLYNFDYEFSGSENIAPTKVFDDGEFTYMEFGNRDNYELPAVYTVDSNGYEALVNYRIVENYLVIEQVASQLTLRSGSDIICIYNNNLFRLKNIR
jgi:type IV secretion system protein VirB9